MDISTVAVPIISGILGIGSVSIFVAKYVTKIAKYVRIAHSAIRLADDAIECLKDGHVDAAEVARITSDVVKLKNDLKG